MDERLRNAYLYDFYGELLTNRQREIYNLHFCEDMSLAEIGERCGISRQGANDALKQAQKSMEDFDKVLCLLSKHFSLQKQLVSAYALLEQNDIEQAKLILKDLMEV
ncbi:MAG: DNA-binding protein [Defluviitaleaceae bacterium]|nr:DNA-binding protein [Defluviitaleaceae bacterium]